MLDCTAKSLARDPAGPRHEYLGVPHPGAGAGVCESWRFPLVEPHFDPTLTPEENARWNEVTFIFAAADSASGLEAMVVGLGVAELGRVRLTAVGDSRYLAASVLLPAGRVFRYLLVVEGEAMPDPLNPQRHRAANGEELSAFFTFGCFEAVTFEPWESALLRRVTNHILPFNTREAQLFQSRPGGVAGAGLRAQLYRLDQSVGVVNYIDKLLAREERHQLPAYRSCLAQINRLLRQRNPYLEPRDLPEDDFIRLYDEMAAGDVPGWDYTAYSNPGYFLFLLRRHTFTGAFCHPKYGGNAGAAGWRWLSDRFPGPDGDTLFAWDRALEPPLGTSQEYRG